MNARFSPQYQIRMHAASPLHPRHKFSEFELLIFDLDGTLIDTSLDLAHAVNYALQALGKTPLAIVEVLKMVGDGARTLLTRALGQHPTEEELQLALLKFREHYATHLADHSRLYKGMTEVLAHFHDRKKAVLTNKPHDLTLALLERLELAQEFVLVQGAQASLPLKPDPTGLHGMLRQLQISTAHALMIGDSENDILVGKAAGVRTCAATYGFRPRESLLALAPDYIIHAPHDLIALALENEHD